MARTRVVPSEPPAAGDLPPASGNGHPAPQSDAVGISLRDYFAAAAVHGVIMRSSANHNALHIADMAYQVADAMLAERDAGNNPLAKAGGLFG
jgi:hypothetical protein